MELGLFTCSTCGALVAAHDWQLHVTWHADQGAQAAPQSRQLIVHAGKRMLGPKERPPPPATRRAPPKRRNRKAAKGDGDWEEM